MAYAPPRHGFRTFFIVWVAQSLSVIGSGMTGFALNVYLAQVPYPAPEQKAELALAFTALNLGFTIPFVFGLITSTLFVLIVLPVIYSMVRERELARTGKLVVLEFED